MVGGAVWGAVEGVKAPVLQSRKTGTLNREAGVTMFYPGDVASRGVTLDTNSSGLLAL